MSRKKCYVTVLLIVMFIGGCQGTKGDNAYQKEDKVVEKKMHSSAKVDPSIDLSSNQYVPIIIEFKTKPAKIAVLEAKEKGITLTLEEAKRQVEQNHQTFRKLLTVLDEKNIPYKVKHTYKTAFNGVSMEMPANEIKRLLSSSVISKIYPNKQIQLDPPINPSEQM
ncbi:protease inhibitor I9 family protein [Cytobacillus sp. BC1816]|uniref:protease inhibitor I9 family protein n=1 Tax=Cytobacillus sp. BC1816 TaxID=3440154 RepID=UPI003F518F87